MRRIYRLLLAAAVLASVGAVANPAQAQTIVPDSEYPPQCREALQQWQPDPSDADLMVITAHPDDEGIFFGGTLPHYTQVEGKKTILVSMSGSERNHRNHDRIEELERAAWHYGVRYKPVNFRYSNASTNVANSWEPTRGFDGVVDRIATELRRYKPEVVVTHDLNGEYGHEAHKLTARATAAAIDVASDASRNLSGLPAFQVKKLYLHRYQAPGGDVNTIPPTKVTSAGYNFHSWESTHAQLGGLSSRAVTNAGLKCHYDAIKVWPNLVAISRFATGEPGALEGHPGEDWGLYHTSVGADTSPGNFFQNVAGGGVGPPPPPAPPVASGAIRNASSNLCVTVRNASTNNDGPVIQTTCNGAANQSFTWDAISDGYGQLRAAHSNKCLHVRFHSSAPSTPIVQDPCDNRGANTLWKQINVGGKTQLQVKSSGLCLQQDSGSLNALIIQAPCNSSNNAQLWNMT